MAALAAGAAVLVGVYGAVHAVATRRQAAMQAAADSAGEAIRGARAAGAATWAPEALLKAERGAREALTAQRVEEVATWPIPSSDSVVAAWASAGSAAREAAAIGTKRREAASAASASQVERAGVAVSAVETLALSIHLASERRSLLAQARSALEESRVYQREGAFAQAEERARVAEVLAAEVRVHAADVASRYADEETVARWRRWARETIDWSRREGRAAIVVFKEAHRLTLYRRGESVKDYRVDLGLNWIADKSQEGDRATPEGRYRIIARNANAGSQYYKALLLDYPNAEDRREFTRARRLGAVPASARIGGLIEIHGAGGRGQDWTSGCVALANADLDDLLAHVGVGTPVTIVGSDDYGAIAEFVVQQRQTAARQP